jgi:hypothetical protein
MRRPRSKFGARKASFALSLNPNSLASHLNVLTIRLHLSLINAPGRHPSPIIPNTPSSYSSLNPSYPT